MQQNTLNGDSLMPEHQGRKKHHRLTFLRTVAGVHVAIEGFPTVRIGGEPLIHNGRKP